jgi:hypothetical protein
LLIGVQFINGGQYPISMQTPDQWDERKADRLDVGGARIDAKGEWAASLAGLPVVNKSELSIDTVSLPMGGSGTFVTIAPGSSVTFKFLAMPNGKVPKGTYTFNVLTVTTIETKGDIPNLSRVDFASDLAKSPRVTFERDYPSTPREWRDYEERQRAKMSSFPVKPGEAFAEDGHYRLVSNSGQRSPFVFQFRKDATAPEWADVADEQGKAFYGISQWQWEADISLEDHCFVGRLCPRDGRWILTDTEFNRKMISARVKFSSRDERRFAAGEPMPDPHAGKYGYPNCWHWLGV